MGVAGGLGFCGISVYKGDAKFYKVRKTLLLPLFSKTRNKKEALRYKMDVWEVDTLSKRILGSRLVGVETKKHPFGSVFWGKALKSPPPAVYYKESLYHKTYYGHN